MASVHSGQPGTFLLAHRCTSPSMQIILELALAVVLAFVSILTQTRRFKLAKEFTQIKRYPFRYSAMIVHFTDLISEIWGQVGPSYCYLHWRNVWGRIRSIYRLGCDCSTHSMPILKLNVIKCFYIDRGSSNPSYSSHDSTITPSKYEKVSSRATTTLKAFLLSSQLRTSEKSWRLSFDRSSYFKNSWTQLAANLWRQEPTSRKISLRILKMRIKGQIWRNISVTIRSLCNKLRTVLSTMNGPTKS